MAEDHDYLVREGEINYAKPLVRALLRDARLSWGARGLFAFLWDLPAGWRPNASHIAKMGPDGRDAVRARLKELEVVGALRIEPIRGDGGQLDGKRWVLVAPERWAHESPLSGGGTPEPLSVNVRAEERVSRLSAKPKIGKPNNKVLQKNQGSAIRRPPPPNLASKVVVGKDLEDLRSALLAEAKAEGKRKPEAWAGAALRRIEKTGANPEDLALLARWHARKVAEATHRARINSPPPGIAGTPQSHSTGLKSVPPPDWAAPIR